MVVGELRRALAVAHSAMKVVAAASVLEGGARCLALLLLGLGR